MDRAVESSDLTSVPISAPALPDGAADVAIAPAVTIQGEPSETAVDGAALGMTSSSNSAKFADPPRPLPPRAFSVPATNAQSPAWFLPIPPPPAAFDGSQSSAGVLPLPRSYVAPAVANTLPVPTRRYGGQPPRAAFQIDSGETSGEKQTAPTLLAAESPDAHPVVQHRPESALAAAMPLTEDRFDQRWAPPMQAQLAVPAGEARKRHTYGALAKRAIRIAAGVAAAWLGSVVLLILAYRFIDPPVSALMVQRWAMGEDIVHEWVDIESMSPHVIRAVLISEDGRFCEHNGVDFEAIQEAVERAGSGTPRGASTISMQVIKNLFLWPSKSYLRKAIELPLTYAMEFIWPKRRIMEVYLNIAEWGPGIFGVETAARFHFNKSARSLSEREASRLAVALPNPMLRDPGDPGPGTQRLASVVQERMRFAPASQTACVLPKRRL